MKDFADIIMVGTFPPPVTGKTVITGAVRDELLEEGAKILAIDLVANPRYIRRSFAFRLSRLPQVLRGLICFIGIREQQSETFYISISDGLAQFYELIFLMIARKRGLRIFLHHHSFLNLYKSRRLTQAIVKAAGPSAIHVTQCSRMAARLQQLYNVSNVVSVSNIVFQLRDTRGRATHDALQTIGYISNISIEKGVLEFLDLMSMIEERGLPVVGKLAGPFQDSDIERTVLARLMRLQNVEYVGPVYGNDKNNFFKTVDALIFPTNYLSETEGIVNLEAMGCGIPVIAYSRGCIPEIVNNYSGKLVDLDDDFVLAAFKQLSYWLENPSRYLAASIAAEAQFSRVLDKNMVCWHELKKVLMNRNYRSTGCG